LSIRTRRDASTVGRCRLERPRVRFSHDARDGDEKPRDSGNDRDDADDVTATVVEMRVELDGW
jgi:hypothetical protein